MKSLNPLTTDAWKCDSCGWYVHGEGKFFIDGRWLCETCHMTHCHKPNSTITTADVVNKQEENMKWVIRIKPGQIKQARKELECRIDKGRTYVRVLPTRDIYTSRKMATKFNSKKEVDCCVHYGIEEAIKSM